MQDRPCRPRRSGMHPMTRAFVERIACRRHVSAQLAAPARASRSSTDRATSRSWPTSTSTRLSRSSSAGIVSATGQSTSDRLPSSRALKRHVARLIRKTRPEMARLEAAAGCAAAQRCRDEGAGSIAGIHQHACRRRPSADWPWARQTCEKVHSGISHIGRAEVGAMRPSRPARPARGWPGSRS